MSNKIAIDLGQSKNLVYNEMTRNTHIIGFFSKKNRLINTKFSITKPTNNLFYVKVLDENDILKTTSLDYELVLHFEKKIK